MNIQRKKWLRRSVPAILCVLFCIISMISLTTILRMQGNARVVNYTGILRGATQLLVKQELNGFPNEKLVRELDATMTGLVRSDEANGLIALPDAAYQDLMKQMNVCWEEIKAEIARVRQGADTQQLYDMSESYFVLADRAVSAAEHYSEKQVSSAKWILSCLNICFVLLATLFWLYDRRQKKVQLALEVAEHASRAKGDFLSRMSHEIRTPLNGIIGMTEIAQMHLDDPKRQADCLKKIETSSKYLLSLINDILDMSRIESGKIELALKVFDLKEMLEQIHGMFDQKAQEQGIAFKIEYGELETSSVVGDDLRLTQILVNLVSNALKFTPAGGEVSLVVRQLVADEQSISLEFLITDTGVGISEAFQAHIFEPFEQEAAPTSRQYGGTGLGLAISSNFVQMMDGEITVRSKLGQGSQFVVRLTLQRASTEADSEALNEKYEQQQDLSGARILLAEDNELNAEIAAVILMADGAQVDWAHNGKEAVEFFRASLVGDYTLILMDIQMPVMDGLEATRTIRKLDRSDAGGIPIIGLSANAFSEDIELALNSGMNGYLSKPIDVARLLATVRSA